jgi:hypothetical protein
MEGRMTRRMEVRMEGRTGEMLMKGWREELRE